MRTARLRNLETHAIIIIIFITTFITRCSMVSLNSPGGRGHLAPVQVTGLHDNVATAYSLSSAVDHGLAPATGSDVTKRQLNQNQNHGPFGWGCAL